MYTDCVLKVLMSLFHALHRDILYAHICVYSGCPIILVLNQYYTLVFNIYLKHMLCKSTCGSGTAKPSGAPELTSGFYWCSSSSSFSFMWSILLIVVCPFCFGHCIVCPSIYGFWLSPHSFYTGVAYRLISGFILEAHLFGLRTKNRL